MVKNLFLLIIIFFSITNGFSQNRSFEINGFVEGKPSGVIFLYCYDEKGGITNSTANIIDHRFYFKGEFVERAKASLSINGLENAQSFFIDTGKINIKLKLDTQNVNGKMRMGFILDSITGSKSQTIWDETVDHIRKIRQCEAPDSVKSEDYYTAMLSLVKQYPQHYVTRSLLQYVSGVSSYEQFSNLFNFVPRAQQETPMGGFLKRDLALLEETQPNTYIFFPVQKDVEREELTLDKLEFKYLLIDFWASWCAPCREEHPNLLKLYDKYKPSGLEILSISLDEQKDRWLGAIKADKLPWQQASDLNGWQTEIVKHYSISGIPYNILIDRNGKIIGSNLRKEILEKKMQELIK